MTELLVPWHFYLQVLAACVVVAVAAVGGQNAGRVATAERMGTAERYRRLAVHHLAPGGLLVLFLASTCLYVEMKQRRRGDRAASYAAAEWIRALPPGSRCAMADSWYVQLLVGPDYHVFDLTGLVTDHHSLSLLQDRDYRGVFEAHAIEYLVGFERDLQKYDPDVFLQTGTFPWDGRAQRFGLARVEASATP